MDHSGRLSGRLPSPVKPYLAMVLLIMVAAATRIWPLGVLGTKIPWLTFYPAVLGAAAYGGFFAGLGGALLSCATVAYAWPLLGRGTFIKEPADWLGVAIFFLNCLMISIIAEAMRRAEARANRARDEADRANRTKSIFLANMSHELRTPLNAILGFSNILRKDATLPSDQRRSLAIIHSSGRHLLALIDEVLDLSKVESGRLIMDQRLVDLWAMVDDLAEILRPRAEENGLRLEVQRSADFPRVVLGDDLRLCQVFLNLVGNAIRYTQQGTVILRLDGRRPADPGGAVTLLIEVEDTGPGIAPQDLSRIFDPFVQVGTNSGKQGVGLGLAITRKIIEMIGGSIRVESVLGQGSIFRVELPVVLRDPSRLVAQNQDLEVLPVLAPGQPIPRVLIVDDNEENWKLLQELLTRAGFLVTVAENGLQGVEAFQSWHPDFIWMDCRMPVLDGLEAAQRIRSIELAEGRSRAVKIVALTASVFPEERDRVLAAGMDDFMRKPFDAAEIFACLSRQLGVTYQPEGESIAKSATTIDPGALGGLPEALRQELRGAITSLDRNRIAEAITRITALDPDLGVGLRREADSLSYTRMLNMLCPPVDEKA